MKKIKILKVGIMGMALLFIMFSSLSLLAHAQQTGQNQTIDKVGQVDVSKLPEATLPISAANKTLPIKFKDPQKFAKDKSNAQTPGFVPPGQDKKNIVNAEITAANFGLILEGAPGASPNPCACTPPDVNLGVGPNHVFQTVNMAGIIYSKTGSVVKNTFSLVGFFGSSTSQLTDPFVVYDNRSGRWFASIADMVNNKIILAVSTANDPTGIWNLYNIFTPSSNIFPDQPFFGISDDKVVVAANDFTTTFVGAQYWVLNKAQLVAGGPVSIFASTPNMNFFSVHPAQQFGSSSGSSYMITADDSTNIGTLFKVDGVPPNPITTSTFNLNINPISIPPDAIQPGTTTLLATNDDRVISATWESNNLWFSLTDACIPTGDTVTRSCTRLVQISTSGTPSKVQDFDYATSGQYFFFPAVSLYQGQLIEVYGLSSTNIFPSALVTGRAPTDPVNTLQPSSTFKSGSAFDDSTRYGDYFGATTDPTPSAGFPFWVTGEYRKTSGFVNWNTAIAQVAGFGGTPPPTTLPAMIFVRGADNGLWYRTTTDGTTFGPWTSLGGIISSDPEASTWFNKIFVFARGQDNGLWYRSYDGTNWSPWTSLGGIINSGAGAS